MPEVRKSAAKERVPEVRKDAAKEYVPEVRKDAAKEYVPKVRKDAEASGKNGVDTSRGLRYSKSWVN